VSESCIYFDDTARGFVCELDREGDKRSLFNDVCKIFGLSRLPPKYVLGLKMFIRIM
jgi:hypothetical protein